jgi:phosphopantetheinyl transferase (holo-ACP synthase)
MPNWIRPATLPFRIGTDIVRVDRIKKIIDKGGDIRPLKSFLHRILTPLEKAFFERRFANLTNESLEQRLPAVALFLAGRYISR